MTFMFKTGARPLGRHHRYEYDVAGNLTLRTSPGGERREYEYDDANRKTDERHYPAGESEPSQVIAYIYDKRNLLTGYTQSGDTHSAAVYLYDAKGQKTEETVTYGQGAVAFSHTTTSGWTPRGHKDHFIYPGGARIDYGWTDNGLLTSATLPGSAGAIHWKAFAWQQPQRVEMPGTVRTLEHDALQRPVRIWSQALGSGTHEAPNGALIMDYRYQYDSAGNITERETEEGAFQYGYDAIDRLTAVTPPPSQTRDPLQPEPGTVPVEGYTYDPVHNRLSSLHQPGGWQYNADNQLLGYGLGAEERRYTYNANGHTQTETTGDPITRTREYRYNAAERLIEIQDYGSPIASYQYDPMGRRIRKETQAGITWFLYSDEGLIAELDATGTLTRTYGWKPGGLWGTDPLWLADKTGSSWQVHLYHNDHLWTPQRLTDTTGAVTWSGLSEAFGKTEALVNTVDNPLRLPGQYEDSESHVHYNYFRDYVPDVGRYVEADPIGLDGGVNAFAYTASRPTMLFDAVGLRSCEPCSNHRINCMVFCFSVPPYALAMCRRWWEDCDGKSHHQVWLLGIEPDRRWFAFVTLVTCDEFQRQERPPLEGA